MAITCVRKKDSRHKTDAELATGICKFCLRESKLVSKKPYCKKCLRLTQFLVGAALKERLIAYKGGKCVCCGCTDLLPRCFIFDHKDGRGRDTKNKNDFVSRYLPAFSHSAETYERFLCEIDKTQLLCGGTCHELRHYFEDIQRHMTVMQLLLPSAIFRIYAHVQRQLDLLESVIKRHVVDSRLQYQLEINYWHELGWLTDGLDIGKSTKFESWRPQGLTRSTRVPSALTDGLVHW